MNFRLSLKTGLRKHYTSYPSFVNQKRWRFQQNILSNFNPWQSLPFFPVLNSGLMSEMPHGVCLSFLKPYGQLFSLFYNLQVLSWCKVYVHLMGWYGRHLSHICHLCSPCCPPVSQPLSPCLENCGENKDWRETWWVVPKNKRACLPSFWLHPCPVKPFCEDAPVCTLRSHQG